MKDEIVGCFVRSAGDVLGSELGGSVTIGGPTFEEEEYVAPGVTGMVGITGRLRGMVIFGLSEGTALGVISKMMGQPYTELDAIARSGVAELGNVIVGSAVTSLAGMGYQCGITPPAVIIGQKAVISMVSLTRVVLPIVTPFGTIEMQLVLRENGLH